MINRTCCPQIHTIRQSLSIYLTSIARRRQEWRSRRLRAITLIKVMIPCSGSDPEPILVSGKDWLKRWLDPKVKKPAIPWKIYLYWFYQCSTKGACRISLRWLCIGESGLSWHLKDCWIKNWEGIQNKVINGVIVKVSLIVVHWVCKLTPWPLSGPNCRTALSCLLNEVIPT